MPVYPGDSHVSLNQTKFLANDGYNNFMIQTGLHVGTHIDTPMHMTKDKKRIADYSLSSFYGNGVILNAYNEKFVSYKEEYEGLIQKDDIVLVYTGHSNCYETDQYYTDYPSLTKELAQFLVDKKIKIVGMDTPSPDYYPFPIHQLFFKHQILMIENLCCLKDLLNIPSFQIYAFPLKIQADASLLRVVAIRNV